jgi:hydrogenase nickel incorporation protein HypA/HybF
MHELAIAQSLIETASAALPAADAMQIVTMQVRLGALAGVSKEELQFGFSVVAKGTPFEGARLEIEDVPVIVYCPHCQVEQVLLTAEPLCCPVCATPTPKIIQGKALTITAIEVN